jgi:hypothetical protein
MNLETWEYGDIAQILHLGGILARNRRYQAFTQCFQEGYEVIGVREEEIFKPG